MTAAEIVPRDQPKSSWSGSISTLGAARKLPAPRSATKAAPATSHGHKDRGRGTTVAVGAASTVARGAHACVRTWSTIAARVALEPTSSVRKCPAPATSTNRYGPLTCSAVSSAAHRPTVWSAVPHT